ncbi:MAG TPA: hypothetical protein VGD52_13640 [Pseudoduganella sp.]
MKRSGIGLLVASVLVPGCASFYQQPGAGEKSAQLAARMPAEMAGFFREKSSLVEISGFADAQCTPGAGKGRVLAFSSLKGVSENARVAAGRRLYLQIYRIETGYKTLNAAQNALHALHKVPGKPTFEMEVTTKRCARVFSFEPEAGKSYEMLVGGDPRFCEASLADASTGTAPPDLQVHPVEGACIPKR